VGPQTAHIPNLVRGFFSSNLCCLASCGIEPTCIKLYWRCCPHALHKYIAITTAHRRIRFSMDRAFKFYLDATLRTLVIVSHKRLSTGVGTLTSAPHSAHSASTNHMLMSLSSNMQPTLKSFEPHTHACKGPMLRRSSMLDFCLSRLARWNLANTPLLNTNRSLVRMFKLRNTTRPTRR